MNLFHPILLFVIVALLCNSCYVAKQAIYQNDLINSRRSIKEMLNEEATPSFVKQRLQYVLEVMSFAEAYNFNREDAYEYFVDLNRNSISYLLFVSPEFELVRHEWWFPVIGSVPYLGFFNEKDRNAEAKKWQTEGFDIHTTGSAAFSSLGWFSDPLYKPMISYKRESDVAHLLFHELTHRSVWIPGEVQKNESLAECVADCMLGVFLKSRNQPYDFIAKERRDAAVMKAWLEGFRKDLEDLYANKELTPEIKRSKKSEIISLHTSKHWPKFQSESFDALRERVWNNATILSFQLGEAQCLPKQEIDKYSVSRAFALSYESMLKMCSLDDP